MFNCTHRTLNYLPIMLFVTILTFCITASADHIILKDGYELKGDILKKNNKDIVVDLGCTVISVSKDDVTEILDKKADDNTSSSETVIVADKTTKQQIYHTAKLERTTIPKNTEKFSEAVVLVKTPVGSGSGFILSEDGYLITNYHVIERETSIKITVFKKSESGIENIRYKKVKIIAFNPLMDLALLKIEENIKFNYVYLGAINELKVGEQAFAIGNPLGLTRTVSQGIISTKNRNVQNQIYIQTTTDINPGNSGGPLFNLKGEVIGVTNMGMPAYGGLNFAIPVDVVKRFIKNREAFAYNEDNPNAGFKYPQPDSRKKKNKTFGPKTPKLNSNNN